MEGNVAHDGDMFKLTTENYSYWKPMMEDHLYCKELHEPILNVTMPAGKKEAEWELLNRKAVAMIRKYIDKSLFEHVSSYTNANELWKKLDTMIQKKTPRNKALLMRRLVKLVYKDGSSIMEHINSFKGVVNQLIKLEMKVEDEMQALLLLSSLPDSWDTLVVTLNNSAPDGTLSMDVVIDSLVNEEARRKERGIAPQFEANVAETRGRSEFRGRNRDRGRSKFRGRSKSRSKFTCYYCGKPGHMKSDCRFLKKDQKAGTVKPDHAEQRREGDQNTTTAAATSSESFLIEEDNCLNLTCDDSTWIIDSGASSRNHNDKLEFSSS